MCAAEPKTSTSKASRIDYLKHDGALLVTASLSRLGSFLVTSPFMNIAHQRLLIRTEGKKEQPTLRNIAGHFAKHPHHFWRGLRARLIWSRATAVQLWTFDCLAAHETCSQAVVSPFMCGGLAGLLWSPYELIRLQKLRNGRESINVNFLWRHLCQARGVTLQYFIETVHFALCFGLFRSVMKQYNIDTASNCISSSPSLTQCFSGAFASILLANTATAPLFTYLPAVALVRRLSSATTVSFTNALVRGVCHDQQQYPVARTQRIHEGDPVVHYCIPVCSV